MKHSILFACIFIIAVTIHGQENKIQVPPIKTTQNVKPQLATTVQAVPIKTAENAKPQSVAVQTVPIRSNDQAQQSKTVQAAQPVPLKKTDDVTKAESTNAIIPAQNKITAPEKSTLPSSVSIKQAQEQSQKKGRATPPPGQ